MQTTTGWVSRMRGRRERAVEGDEKGWEKKCFAKNYKERRARGEAVEKKIGDWRRREEARSDDGVLLWES